MRILLFTAVSIYASFLLGQQPYSYHLDQENGLPSREVYQIKQDGFGYLWIGCDAGLYRYDGFQFTGITPYEFPRSSISNLKIFNRNQIYCQNFLGQIFRASSFSDHLELVFDASELVSNFPDYTVDTQGNTWVLADTVLIQINPRLERLRTFQLSEFDMQSDRFASIGMSPNGKIALVDYKGTVVLVDPISGRNSKIKEGSNAIYRYQFFESPDKLFLSIENGDSGEKKYRILQFQSDSLDLLFDWLSFKNARILNFQQFGENIFCSTDNGLYRGSQEGINQRPPLFSGNKISSVLQDRETMLWCTSLQNGIHIIPSLEIINELEGNTLIKDPNLTAIISVNSKELYMGNYSGRIFSSDRKSLEIKALSVNEKLVRATRKILLENELFYVARGPFHILKNGKIWEELPKLMNTRDFIKVGDTLFYTSSDRTGFIVKTGKQWRHHTIRNKGGRQIVYADGVLFVLFPDGLHQYAKNKLSRVESKEISGSIVAIGNYQNQLVFATSSGSLFIQNGRIYEHWLGNVRDLRLQDIRNFFIQNREVVFVSGIGITYVDIQTGISVTLNQYDGMIQKEINGSVILNDRVFLATNNGLISFPKNLKVKNSIAPSLRIKEIIVNGQSFDPETDLDLQYNDYQIVLKLSSVSFRSRGNYQYKYRLKGLSDSWQFVDAEQQEISFTSLPPGKYHLEITAINEDGVESKKISKKIFVSSPIYQKWWFYLFLLITILITMYILFRWQIRTIRKKSLLKQQYIRAQLTALKAQMNPHFLFNTLNSLQDLILRQDFKSTNYYLSKYSALMRMILSNSEKQTVEIEEEIKMLQLYLELEKLRFGDEFQFNVSCQPQLIDDRAQVPPMIIQPFIENAIKHGLLHKIGEKNLTISFKLAENKIICEIEDNGIGRLKSQEINERQQKTHQSFSTQATGERMRLMQDFYGQPYEMEILDLFESNQPCGTKILLKFPIS
ncbi:MAG: histidine kinase [Crocinitomicaceae bacterium]